MSEVITGTIGERAVHAISRLREETGRLAVGNVLRRTCEWAAVKDLGEAACKEACQLRESCTKSRQNELPSEYLEAVAKRLCADENLSLAFTFLDLDPYLILDREDNLLIVGVTDNRVGFGDHLEKYEREILPQMLLKNLIISTAGLSYLATMLSLPAKARSLLSVDV